MAARSNLVGATSGAEAGAVAAAVAEAVGGAAGTGALEATAGGHGAGLARAAGAQPPARRERVTSARAARLMGRHANTLGDAPAACFAARAEVGAAMLTSRAN